MNAVRNALNEIRVLIPKKLVEEVTDASKNRGIFIKDLIQDFLITLESAEGL